MPNDARLLAIDQGTTSSRAVLFGASASPLGTAQREFAQHYPASGWVEHDPEEIWTTTLEVTRAVLRETGTSAAEVTAIGITNQRETVLVWDRTTGETIYPAIVWQDRRTRQMCEDLKPKEPEIAERTGLLLDPYFSATKVAWILDHVPGARDRAERGDLAFGTVDCFLIWRLTGGSVHATDATNASRTLLFDIRTQRWDAELLDWFRVPSAMLPEVRDCADDFGRCATEHLGAPVPIRGVAGDQQAATVGQACFEPGTIKCTFGTGCFLLLNCGDTPVRSRHRLLTTVAYRIGGRVTYALEGSIFVAGAAVQWLRDGLGVIGSAAETERLADELQSAGGVYLVPAFTGLGAPHWDPDARGALFGLTRDTGVSEIARAALESVCFQTQDLLEAMRRDGAAAPALLRVDGGMVANDWLMQFLADQLDVPVDRAAVHETTALGAAFLAGLQSGVFSSLEDIADHRRRGTLFEPGGDPTERTARYTGWQDAVRRTRSVRD